jgi:hypothetical protein
MAHKRDGGDDAENVSLEWKPRLLRHARRPWQADKVRDRRWASSEQPRTVLQSLNWPPLIATGKRL